MGSAQMTDFMRNTLIDHVFRGTQWSKPTSLQILLYTANPTHTGTDGTRVNTTGCLSGGRIGLFPTSGNWYSTCGQTTVGLSTGVTAGGGTTGNATAIVFGTPTANWGTVTGFSIEDQAPNILMWDALTNPKTVNNGDPAPSFPANALQITFS
jgi:hypothetical protein